MKLRDLKKFGYRDHVIFELKEREVLADFMIEFADQNEDDIVFELKEEF